ncbi:hypothetical protein DZA50_02705 [Kangiella sp. HD9-110m-PIT-SAG07]|nr:hypothetical protein DZA50_02705 [Kangiella sp. HD9-110m-PIT-SAG07]
MSHWNRAYLDALEVPVWVPLNDQRKIKADDKIAEKAAAQPASQPASAGSEREAVNTTADVVSSEFITFLKGDVSADYIFVVSKSANPDNCASSMKQLEFAWKSWLDQPLSAALAQISEMSEQSHAIDTCRGKVIVCGDEIDYIEHPSISAPDLELSQANKKDWWGLLQRLQ